MPKNVFSSHICISEVSEFFYRPPDMSSMIGCCNLQIIPCPLHLWLCHIQAPSAASNYLLETQPSMIQMTDLKSYRSPASSLDLLHSCIAVHCFQSATYSMNSKYSPLQVSLHLPFRHTSIILSVLSLWPECMDLGALFLFVTAIVQKQDWCLTKAALFMGLHLTCRGEGTISARALSLPVEAKS